ncbi:hypothetical protein MLD38_025723 [Melastoma candidum]|uniref:Uncharacterized protein n=1 Tax=Melastoma candidum TaxID=119954 RepID=A0ACB9NW68_9MYRT|nr:hypothetical protein MLD38_025723 [Melastoma candidum]
MFKAMESSGPPPPPPLQLSERKTIRPHKDQALNCPRCDSTNTKFCYYNNYSLSQPRYFCKACRRYWTEGGSFRNVPVGGSSRKNKRSPAASSSSSSSGGSMIKPPAEHRHQPRATHQGHDLNLAFPSQSGHDRVHEENPTSPLIATMGLSLGSFMPPLPTLEMNTGYSAGFPLVEFRPSLGFPTSDVFENEYGSLHRGFQEITGAKLFFPVEDSKQAPSPRDGPADHRQLDHERQKGDVNMYWNGVPGGGSW